jgi:hypothetical protein
MIMTEFVTWLTVPPGARLDLVVKVTGVASPRQLVLRVYIERA